MKQEGQLSKLNPLELLVALGMAAAIGYSACQSKVYVQKKVEQCPAYRVCEIEDWVRD
ncbi:MAG: hypothetical protein AABX37_00375 [Nanoarchaeota archaeon]